MVQPMRNYKTYNRRGVTLLFVISMIVLFLLMGTTFVVVSNDFRQAAQIRNFTTLEAITTVGERVGDRFVSQALFDLLREPDLENTSSPLRGHSILGDMYGYGFTSYVKNVEDQIIQTPSVGAANSNVPQFVRLELIGPDVNIFSNTVSENDFEVATIGNSVLDGRPVRSAVFNGEIVGGSAQHPPFDLMPTTPGRFTGQLLTFVSGDADGITARIVDHQVFPIEEPAAQNFVNNIRYEHRFVIMLLNPTPTVRSQGFSSNVVAYDDPGRTSLPTRVVVNSRPFSGTGAGIYNPMANFNAPALNNAAPNLVRQNLLPDPMAPGVPSLTGSYLTRMAPAQNGTLQPRSNWHSTNENYDAVDLQNMFLASQPFSPTNTNTLAPIASFHDRNGVNDPFRPDRVFVGAGGPLDAELTTAGPNYPFTTGLDVDSDGDGVNDSVFIDIGLSSFVNRQGKRVKPLVAYHVIDLDSKININNHGNRSQVSTNGRLIDSTLAIQPAVGSSFIAPGDGFGPSEILLNQVFPGTPPSSSRTEADRLIVGEVLGNGTIQIAGRYGVDSENDRRLEAGGGPVPGFGGIVRENLSAYKLFGYPVSADFQNDPGVIFGGFYQSRPMDIYGRFYTGFPQPSGGSPFTTSMPIIDMSDSGFNHNEIVNHPYEVNYGLTPSPFDQLYTLDELEQIYRQSDAVDAISNSNEFGRFGRLGELVPSMIRDVALADLDPLNDRNRFAFTTDSWEVPTLCQEIVGDNFETIAGKLYNILSTQGSTFFGINMPATTSSQIIMRERVIMANISSFIPEINPTTNQIIGRRTFLPQDLASTPPIQADTGMLPGDIRSGRPFNINRPFGNGLDDNNDGVIDNRRLDPISGNSIAENDGLAHPASGGVEFDHNNDGIDTGDGSVDRPNISRQQFARYLYVLTLLATEFVDRNNDGDFLDVGPDMFEFDGSNPTNFSDRLAYRRAIAQWVVNVVDFRDADSIMTPFEFDVNPFNGWDADGDLVNTPPGGDVEVVWGTERPELLITEAIAIHDVRTEDTNQDVNGGGAIAGVDGTFSTEHPQVVMDGTEDSDFDSRYVPNASAFFELYNPWEIDNSANSQIVPQEFGATGVDLLKMTANGVPVWRMVAVNTIPSNTNTAILPASAYFDQTTNPDVSINFANPLDPAIVRYVYFNQPSNAAAEFTDNKVYYPVTSVITANNSVVAPGSYAVVGSSGITAFGLGNTNVFTTYLGRKSGHVAGTPIDMDTRRIELDRQNSEVRVYSTAGLMNMSTGVTVLPINGPTQSVELPSGTPGDFPRSLGLTDPVNGYTVGTAKLQSPDLDGLTFFNPATGMEEVLDFPADKDSDGSFDDSDSMGSGNHSPEASGQFMFYNEYYGRSQLTSGAFCILLQRLANPNDNWDPVSNPYRTIDSTGCDVFSFNGVETMSSSDPDGGLMNNGMEYFSSYERRSNQQNNEADQVGNAVRMPFRTEFSGTLPTGNSPPSNPNDHVLGTDFINTLGTLNAGYVNNGGTLPFSWMTWNNRPFANAYELTLVPATSSYFLTSRFNISQNAIAGIPNAPANAYAEPTYNPNDTTTGGEAVVYRRSRLSGEFPHLLNFHNDQGETGFLQRLFDYVEVPSPYVGTETYLNPGDFIAPTAVTANVQSHLSHSFAPPFDFVSNYRRPGKVNLNTITDFRVWNAIMNNYATNLGAPNASFNNWRTSIEGAGGPGDVDNPLRAHVARNYVSQAPGGGLSQADAGLFRRSDPSNTNPLFDYAPATDPTNLTSRNAYYRYHMRNRLGNLVTNRSSVFAIWITIGYFEVIEETNAQNDAGQIVTIDVVDQEAEDENSLTTRNRGFFIVDRSIPVAFEPGKNHNVDRAIRVSSFIE